MLPLAKDITIAEGGVGRNFGSTTKLKTDLMGGGTQYWIPEDEAGDYVTKRHLNVTQNGTYTPEDGFYDEVTVNVAINEETYGIDPDTGTISTLVTDPEDGEKYIVSVEPDGTITRTLFPTKMVITTPPAKTTYTEGETMDYTGIVCTLYDKAGNVFTDDVYTTGVIPFAELEFPVTIAPEGSGGGGGGSSGGYVPEDNPFDLPAFSFSDSMFFYWGTSQNPSQSGIYYQAYQGFEYGFFGGSANERRFILASANSSNKLWGFGVVSDPHDLTLKDYENILSYTYQGKTVYYATSNATTTSDDYLITNIDVQNVNIDSPKHGMFAWLMIYGGYDSAKASIPVLWTSPQPHFPVKAKFRETFEIEVTDA